MRWRGKSKDHYEWHRWFAWFPVKTEVWWVWLEHVDRCRFAHRAGGWWEYREVRR
jgi:thiosulfate reductase cytochrome b subunit